jgi:hypothetical protein
VKHLKCLVLDYPDVVEDPARAVEQLQRFLGPEWIKRPEAMAAAVRPKLYRERSAPEKEAKA